MTEEHSLPSLPNGWIWTKLADIAEVMDVNHKMPKSVKEGILFVSPKDFVGSDSIDFENAKRISEEDFLELSRKCKPQAEDIIYSRIGTIGKARKVPSGIKFQISYSLCLIRPISSLKESSILYVFLKSPYVLEQALAKRRSIGVPDLGLGDIGKFRLPLPPLGEQCRIVSRVEELFSCLDAGVESLLKVKTLLKRYRQAVLKYAFEGKLTEEWRKTHKDQIEPAQKLLEHMKQEREKNTEAKQREMPPTDKADLPKLPEEWIYAKLGDFCDSVDRINPKTEPNKEFIYLEIASIDNHQKITAPRKYLGKDAPSRARQLMESGDTLFSTVRTYLRHIAIVDGIYDGQIASTGFCVIRPCEPVDKKWVFYLVQTDSFLNPLTKIQRGTSYPAVRDSDVFAQVSPLAPLTEQRRIVEEVESCLSKADKTEKIVEQSLRLSERLRQSILKIAFEGKLIPQDPSDEPARNLLDRINKESGNQRAITKSKRDLENTGLMRYGE